MDDMAHAVESETRYCEGCPLKDFAYVVSDGYSDCPVMCVGTAPGRIEELSGIAFTGPSGEVLREILGDMGLFDRVFYTNVLKRRAVKSDGTDRTPSREECWKCGSHLMHEIVRNRPRVILSLGATPLAFLTGNSSFSISQVHGLPIPVTRYGLTFKVIPSFAPSQMMRKGGLSSKLGNEWISDLEEFAREALSA